MAEIYRYSSFSDNTGSPKRALVDSKRRVIFSLWPVTFYPGEQSNIPSGADYSLVSYTVPSNYKFYLVGWTGTGSADGVFTLYKNSTKILEGRNSVAQRNISDYFNFPAEFHAGDVITLKVRHFRSDTQSFFGALVGFSIME